MRIVLIGPQGAGKGTHAKELSKLFSVPHIEAGDMLRHYAAQPTVLGKKLKKYLDKGQLVAEHLTNEMIKHRLEQPDCKKGWILDGYPRSLGQAEFLDEFAEVGTVLELRVPDDVAVHRLSNRWMCPVDHEIYGLNHLPKKAGMCDTHKKKLFQRDDDKPEAIKERLAIYHDETEPLLEYYKPRGIVRSVDAGKEQAVVFKEIVGVLGEFV